MKILKYVLTGLIVFFVISTPVYVTWISFEPEQKTVEQILDELKVDNRKDIVGDAMTASIIFSIKTVLTKNGGYTNNDIYSKIGVFDNMPNWEKGVLFQSRDLALALRNEISRSQSQSKEDEFLQLAQPDLNYPIDAWFPLISTEKYYNRSLDNFEKYLNALRNPKESNSQFYARADNLVYWLTLVEKRLGSLSQRLSASVDKDRVNTDLANDNTAEQSTNSGHYVSVSTPWLELDDVFWEARGSTWALLLYMKAAKVDFESVLNDKNALISVEQVIRELEASQSEIWSPMVLNGGGFGIVSNHSLTMANYISRANAAIIDLRDLLKRG